MGDDLFDDLLDLAGDDVVSKDRTVYKRAPFGMPGAKARSLKHIMPEIKKRVTLKGGV